MRAKPMRAGAPKAPTATVVTVRAGIRTANLIILPALCAGVAWLLRLAAGWIASWRWAPAQEWFELAARVPEPWGTIGSLALGMVAGLILAVLVRKDEVAVAVDDEKVTITHRDESRDFPHSAITAVFLEKEDHLVLLGQVGEELLRQDGGLPDAEEMEAAFRAHGYPWHGEDPHKDDYLPWADDDTDDAAANLPEGAGALLRARARELERGTEGDAEEDAARLRDELGKLGIVVRDEDGRQLCRRTGRPRRER